MRRMVRPILLSWFKAFCTFKGKGSSFYKDLFPPRLAQNIPQTAQVAEEPETAEITVESDNEEESTISGSSWNSFLRIWRSLIYDF